MFKCSNVPMVQWSNVTMLGCLDIQMFNDFGYSQGFFFRNAMYFNSFSGAGVSSGWVKHNFRLVSRFKSSNLSMFQSSNVQMFICSNVLMFNFFWCSIVPMFKCWGNVKVLWSSKYAVFSPFFVLFWNSLFFVLVVEGRCVFRLGDQPFVQMFKCPNIPVFQWSNDITWCVNGRSSICM